jgi:uncharacterized protein (TIGR02266 family)
VTTPERRQHPRLSIDVDVDFRSGNNFYAARTRDISSGGLFIETDAQVTVGTALLVDLKFLKKHVRVVSEVAWTLEQGGRVVGFGVRFLDLRPSVQRSIEAFMALRAPMQCGEVVEDCEAGARDASVRPRPGSGAEATVVP